MCTPTLISDCCCNHKPVVENNRHVQSDDSKGQKSLEAKAKMLAGLSFRGKNLPLCFFWLLEATCIPWPMTLFLHLSSQP